MMERGKLTNRIQALFKIVTILQRGNYKTGQLCELTGLKERTLYRNIQKIEELGFVIDKDFQGRFFIDTTIVPDFLKGYLKNVA